MRQGSELFRFVNQGTDTYYQNTLPMKILKRILLGLLILIVLLFASLFFYIQSIKPDYDGSLSLDGLSAPVEVFFDDYGIPHLYANNSEDLYMAFGYQHAQERLWQMELLRRVAPGRLSEVFGPLPDVLGADRFFRTLNINASSEKSVKALRQEPDSPVLAAAEAYLRGVNAFIEDGYTPIEYTLTGLEKTPFELKDLYNVVGYMSFSFAHAHRVDPWVTAVTAKLGTEYINDLSISVDPNTTLIQNSPNTEAYAQISAQASQVVDNLPVPTWIGSNSWVIGPEKSATGKVLFANDPHIEYAQPSVWYEAHLNTPDDEIYGYFIAGMPFAFLAHNQHMALGLTMFQNDDLDLFQEQVNPDNPNQYKHNGEWKNFTERTETIKVKGAEDVVFTVKESVHGPIANGVLDNMEADPISMWWVYNALPNRMLHVAYEFNYAKNLDDGRAAASKIHAPGLNVMYGDKDGNVAWWASASLPKRPDSVNSKTILNGDGRHDPIGFLPFSANPQAENPPWHYVYSANNQPDTIDNSLYPGYYLPEDRAKRIVTMIEGKDKIDLKDMENMLVDDQSQVVTEIISELNIGGISAEGFESICLKELVNWDGKHGTDALAPVVYQAFIYRVIRGALADELGDELFDFFITTAMFKRSIAKLANNPNSVWWDDVNTEAKETREDIAEKAFREAVASIEEKLGNDITKWQWGKVHTLEHGHPIGSQAALRPYFNVGPFEVNSSVEAVNNLGFTIDGDSEYNVTFGPSTRRIVDFSDLNNSRSILPTGNSGNPFSEHYDDQAEMYVNGEFRPMLIDIDAIKALSRKLTLNPK